MSIMTNLTPECKKHIEAARALFIKIDEDDSGELYEDEVK